ncbi:hypothetical protein FAI40_02335 [Acetobacteraceae bacterium]|nr:hypothetical protein FAI40_02335 [Acetobacteraceae bacterium]
MIQKTLIDQHKKTDILQHPFVFIFRGLIFLFLFDVSFFEIFDPLLIGAILLQFFAHKDGLILRFIKSYAKAIWYPERTIGFLFKGLLIKFIPHLFKALFSHHSKTRP